MPQNIAIKQTNNKQEFRANLIDSIVSKAQKMSKDKIFYDFILAFFSTTSENTLEILNQEKLLEVANQTYLFSKTKTANDTIKIRVYNSDKDFFFDRTIIEICTNDSPFIVNSLLSALSNNNYKVYEIFHPVIKIERNAKGEINKIYDFKNSSEDLPRESIVQLHISRVNSLDEQEKIAKLVKTALNFVKISIEDWKPIVHRAETILKNINGEDRLEVEEAKEFIKWLLHENFVFLGYVKYDVRQEDKKKELVIDEKSRLGIFRAEEKDFVPLGLLKIAPDEFANKPREVDIIEVIKSLRKSIVHRSVNMDYIMIKIYGEDSQVIEEHCLLGLFASRVYFHNTLDIPFIRKKIDYVLQDSGFRKDSHSGKALIAVLQNYPRDELFQISKEELSLNARRIVELSDRPSTKIFVRKDRFARFLSFLIFVPREYFTTDLRHKIQDLLVKEYRGQVTDYYTQLTELPLARLNVILKLDDNSNTGANIDKIEEELIALTSSWVNGLRFIIESENKNNDYRAYLESFSDNYRVYYTPASAFEDIKKVEEVYSTGKITVSLVQDSDNKLFYLNIYTPFLPVALSEVLPILQNTGFYTLDERNFEVKPINKDYPVWVNHFRLKIEHKNLSDFEDLRVKFEASIIKIWHKEIENDVLNKLVVLALASWRDIEIIRFYTKYLTQISFLLGSDAVVEALTKNFSTTRLLIDYFKNKFDPNIKENIRKETNKQLEEKIKQNFSNISNVNEDKILRQVFAVISATLRTNYFQNKDYISCKINSHLVPNLPSPKPYAEIFVYSNSFEGIHLRGGKVARGGLRWSDRRDDFRTEVLGLVKAQMVKNAVIVPVGSKGGFVVKNPSPEREKFLEQGKECYRTYLSGLLDITDNLVEEKIIVPNNVVRYDENDPYLVVAADKGTATFSDIANSISEKYGFWLGDAFASGGSAGYDHKKMGITAKGGWIAVQRHFAELGIDIEKSEFSVVGIGDLSGDVFGNGMILSDKIQLIGAFNHLHIFIDPNPMDAKKSYEERLRIFNLPRSNWVDYNSKLISKGGGVFERKAKTILLTKEIKDRFEITENEISPDDLIKKILSAKVDLLWNGGIGTYFKASEETDEATGDKTNNNCRINASDLKAKVIGEGGNLGFTQKARIEYALNGGKINTDAIDNSAGVDCSDHEVNIKIALFQALKTRKINLEKRNEILSQMENKVAELVLKDNFEQTFSLSIAENQKDRIIDEKFTLIKHLETIGSLDTKLEFLPDQATINIRKANKTGFTRPELAVVLAYSKMNVFDKLINSNFAEDKFARGILINYFPKLMHKKFESEILSHRLKKEIICTVVTNHIINRMGSNFFFRIAENKSVPFVDIARGFYIVNEVFSLEEIWQKLMVINVNISAENQTKIVLKLRAFVEKSIYWFLKNSKDLSEIEEIVKKFSREIADLKAILSKDLNKDYKIKIQKEISSFEALGVDKKTAEAIAQLEFLNEGYSIIQISHHSKFSLSKVVELYFQIAEKIGYSNLKSLINNIIPLTTWEKMAKKSLEEEVEDLFIEMVCKIFNEKNFSNREGIDGWVEKNQQKIEKFKEFLLDIGKQERTSNSMLIVAINKFHSLI